MNSSHILILDIETNADENKIRHLEKPEAPKNYKDKDKINAYIEEKEKEQRDKMALNIDLAKITAMGFSTDWDSPEHTIFLCNQIDKEINALEFFWEYAKFSTIIGYNILKFDLPIILRRSWMLGVQPTVIFTPYDPDIIDLMQKLYPYYGMEYKGLKKICRIYGIDNPMDGIDGSMTKDMPEEELIKYLANDITITQQLAKKMKGYFF